MNDWIATPQDGCCWVTGASSGIGRAVALRLASDGWTVAASARGEAALADLAAAASGLPGTIHPFPLDVTDAPAAATTVAEIEAAHGPIVLAILNAGIYTPVDICAKPDTTPFVRSMEVNYFGAVHCLVPLITLFTERRKGHLVLVSSVTGYGGLPTSAAYGPTKAALINLAESLKFDLDRAGVRTSVVCPGFVDTPATESNPFPMPFLIPADEAANRIVDGIATNAFEITFPRRFTYGLKLINMLPRRVYFWLVKRATGWT